MLHLHARRFAALLACVLALVACADEIERWQPPAELGVCARTPAVRDAIVSLTDRVHSCADIDATDLTAIKQLDLRDREIAALQGDDFAGLTRLNELRLNSNALHSLPNGLFEGLAALRLVHLHDNPGSPFPLPVEIRFNQRDTERQVYLWLPLRPPSRIVAHVHGDGVVLASFAAVIDEGSYVSPEIGVGRITTSAGSVRVLRFAADVERRDCGAEPCWTGIRLVPGSAAVAVPSLPGDGEPPQGLPTLVLHLHPQSFAIDAVVEQGVVAGSGRWRYYQYAERPEGSGFSDTCIVTTFTTLTHDGRGASGSYDYEGRCRLAMGSGSSTPAYELPLNRIGTGAGDGLATDLRSGEPSGASADLRIVADAGSFSKTERINAVSFDAESRCYYYISVAQDPNHDEPIRFADGEWCVVEAVDRRVSAAGCTGLVWWGGWGFGGIGSLAEARADAALIRPYLNGEEHVQRHATIAACETLAPVLLALDVDSFRASPVVDTSITDE